jgi:hypothetical protein
MLKKLTNISPVHLWVLAIAVIIAVPVIRYINYQAYDSWYINMHETCPASGNVARCPDGTTYAIPSYADMEAYSACLDKWLLCRAPSVPKPLIASTR